MGGGNQFLASTCNNWMKLKLRWMVSTNFSWASQFRRGGICSFRWPQGRRRRGCELCEWCWFSESEVWESEQKQKLWWFMPDKQLQSEFTTPEPLHQQQQLHKELWSIFILEHPSTNSGKQTRINDWSSSWRAREDGCQLQWKDIWCLCTTTWIGKFDTLNTQV